MKRTIFPFLLLSLLLLAACNAGEQSVAETIHETQNIAAVNETTTPNPTLASTATATDTPLPTITATATLTPTATSTATPTPTLTITPFFGFERSSFTGVVYDGGAMKMIFTVPGVDQEYTLLVEGQQLSCAPSDQYENTLVCTGSEYDPTFGELACDFYTGDGKTLLYSSVFTHSAPAPSVPENPPWAISWSGSNSCVGTRETVSCETEWRTFDATKCFIASCYNACGYYYSINTCKGLTGELKFHEQWPGFIWDPYYALNWAPKP